MDKNEIVVREHFLPAGRTEKNQSRVQVFVDYEQIRDDEYVFISRPVQDTEIRFASSEHLHEKKKEEQGEGGSETIGPEYSTSHLSHGKYASGSSTGSYTGSEDLDSDDIIDVDFEEYIPEKERAYYLYALASGLLTGILGEASSVFTFLKSDIDDGYEETNAADKELKKNDRSDKKFIREAVLFAAKLDGYKGRDYKKAIRFLIDKEALKAVRHVQDPFSDIIGEAVELSARPSVSGLLFSILVQFSGKIYYADGPDNVQERDVPDHYIIGDSYEEKLLLGILYWFFYASAETIRLGQDALKDTRLPGAFRKLIEDIGSGIDLQKVPGDFQDLEKKYSGWLEKLISDSSDYNDAQELRVLFDEKMKYLCRDIFPVLLNNCLVRALYVLGRIRTAAEGYGSFTLEDLLKSGGDIYAPEKHRILSNMCLIASGTFAAINIGHATVNVFLKSRGKTNKEKIKDFVSDLNIAGIGNFVIAFADNTRYVGENIEVFLNNTRWAGSKTTTDPRETAQGCNYFFEQDMQNILDEITFNEVQLRMVHSLERLLIKYDIDATVKENEVSLKKQWLGEWEAVIIGTVGEKSDHWFIEDEELIFDELYRLSREEKNRAWIYLLILELEAFKPYSGIESGNNKEFSKLKVRKDYIKDRLIRRQTVATQEEAEKMKKLYLKYMGILNDSTQNRWIGAGSTAAAATIIGGVALVFAPGIAVGLVGSSFSGLYGAALTNASLAMLGGGSLAAGGFGMAGGTAVIAGGGAILGAAGSGTISMAAVMLATSKGVWDEQFAKLLVYGRYILSDRMQKRDSYIELRDRISYVRSQVENMLSEMKKEKNRLDEKSIKLTESFLKRLRKLDDEMKKK